MAKSTRRPARPAVSFPDLRARTIDHVERMEKRARETALRRGRKNLSQSLRRHIVGHVVERSQAHKEFLDHPAFDNVLAAFAGMRAPYKRAATVLAWLVRARNCWPLMCKYDPEDAARNGERSASARRRVVALLREAFEFADFNTQQRILRALECAKQSSAPTGHAWADWIDPAWLPRAGGKPMSKWRSVLVRGLDEQLPADTPSRHATIAALVAACGDASIRPANVAKILLRS